MQGYQDVYMELSWMSVGLILLAFMLSKNTRRGAAPDRALRIGGNQDAKAALNATDPPLKEDARNPLPCAVS